MGPVHTETFSCMSSVQQEFLVLMSEKQQKVIQISLFSYAIYSSADAHCWQCVSAEE